MRMDPVEPRTLSLVGHVRVLKACWCMVLGVCMLWPRCVGGACGMCMGMVCMRVVSCMVRPRCAGDACLTVAVATWRCMCMM